MKRFRLTSVILALALATVLVAGYGHAAEKLVKVGVYENPPLTSTGEDGREVGIFPDILEAVAAREDWQIQYVRSDWATCLKLLTGGKIDLLMPIGYSKARASKISYNRETVLTNYGQLCARNGLVIRTVLDLKGKKVALLKGDIFHGRFRSMIESFQVSCTISDYDSYLQVMEAVATGRADAGVVNRLWVPPQALKAKLHRTPIIFSPIEIRFAAPKGASGPILAALDQWIAKFKQDPGSIYHSSITHWLGISNHPRGLPSWGVWTMVLTGVAAALFLLLALIMRSMVRSKTSQLAAEGRRLRREVSQRAQAQEDLLKSEEKYRQLVENILEVPFSLNRQGVVTYISPAVKKTAGFLPEDIMGQYFGRFIHVSDLPRVSRSFARLLSGEAVETEFRVIKADKTPLWVRLSSNPIFKESKVAGVTGILIDISQQKRAEEARRALESQLMQAQKMEAVGTLAGGVAHDFNNILAAITGYAELSLDADGLDPGVKDNQRHILQSAERGANLVQHILAFSRKVETHLEPMNCNQVLTQAAEILKKTLPKMVTIKTGLEPGLKLVMGHAQQLEMVFMNLGSNAKDAMPNGGVLTMTSRMVRLETGFSGDRLLGPGEYVLLEVSDTGQGMEPEVVQHIFDPFFTTKEVGKGTGLGLSSAFGTIKAHGGHILCRSKPGQGTVFGIYLPVAGETARDQREKSGSSFQPGRGEKILLVDDEAPVLDVGRQLLVKNGYRVVTARTGEEALKLYRQNGRDIDLVVLDLSMPGMGGLKCLRELCELDSRVKVLLASGYSPEENLEDLQLDGRIKYLAKPYRASEMLARISSMLA